ncbi:hypothetical protein [Mycobacterium sp. Marseille-P9652]|uniref:hypothetical protein n=1 Tax=Mycobacterium sp. Marseille-P9652 TaxID=2654950 RepID=UPI0012E70C72|nr:hypothetical protein [Mycobacterium sp. Marseille-P9652]
MGTVVSAAAAMVFTAFSVVTTLPVPAQAAPCAGDGANPVSCQNCLMFVEAYHTSNVCDHPAPPRPVQSPQTRLPLPTPEAPPEPLPLEPVPPVQTPKAIPPSPSPPSTVPVQSPRLNLGGAGVPKNASVVTPPKGLDAPPQAVADARGAPATRIDPANPPLPPMQVYDFDHQVQNVVDAHNGNVDVVHAGNQELVRPRHWDYVDYDEDHRPALYNPLSEAMTFRYRYNGAYREAFVPAGGRIVLDVAAAGEYPFTAVGFSHVASGSFHGGAWIPPAGSDVPPPRTYAAPPPPELYQDVPAYVAAANQTVVVGQVQVLGHDDSQPAGGQDTFLLDDSTLAWGQVSESDGNGQIKVTKTQSLPGAGPTDNGSLLIALAALKPPVQHSETWWRSALGYGGLGLVACLAAWLLGRRNRNPDVFVDD